MKTLEPHDPVLYSLYPSEKLLVLLLTERLDLGMKHFQLISRTRLSSAVTTASSRSL